MDHACADRTCAFCKATSSTKRHGGKSAGYQRPPVLQGLPSPEATRELSSWARLQEMQDAFTNRTQLEELERMALIDRASGLPNSRTFHREYGREFARARRQRCYLSLCLIDILVPPEAQKQHGIFNVDTVLKSVATMVQASLRETDIAGRTQKDTIAIVLPDCEAQGALIFAERMRANLHNEIRARQGYWGIVIRIATGTYPSNASDKDQLMAKVQHTLSIAHDSNAEIVYVR